MAVALRDAWGHADEEATGDAAVRRLRDPGHEPYDVVVTDLRLPGADGIAVLEAARARDERTRVLVLTAFATIDTAVRAMRAGAFDFVEKPLDIEQLDLRVGRAIEHRRLLAEVPELRAERAARRAAAAIIAKSPAMMAVVELARRVAPKRSNVLLTGETGTGKELFAGLIHEASPRASGPLVKVNCAALPETLLESELFGHERGCVHAAPTAVASAASKRRAAERSSSTRSASCRPRSRRSSCACSRTRSSTASAEPRRCAPTRAWSPRPTSTSRPRCGAARSAKTSTSAST